MSDAEKFQATEKAKAMFPTLQKMVDDAAFQMSGDLIDAGQKPSEAGSVVAHLFIQAAWTAAGVGAIADGRPPRPDRFRAAVEDALERVAFKTEFEVEETSTENQK